MEDKYTYNLETNNVSDYASAGFGWRVETFGDITRITYWEKEDGEMVDKNSFEISAGYDEDVFKIAIGARQRCK